MEGPGMDGLYGGGGGRKEHRCHSISETDGRGRFV